MDFLQTLFLSKWSLFITIQIKDYGMESSDVPLINQYQGKNGVVIEPLETASEYLVLKKTEEADFVVASLAEVGIPDEDLRFELDDAVELDGAVELELDLEEEERLVVEVTLEVDEEVTVDVTIVFSKICPYIP